MLDHEDYLLLKSVYTELKIQNDLKILEMKLEYGELKPTGNIRKRIKDIEQQRINTIKQPSTDSD